MTFRAVPLRGVLILALSTLLVGCASFGAPSYPTVAGEYEGSLSVQGQAIDGELSIEQAGNALQAVFIAASLGLRAEGEGFVDTDGAITLTLQYDLQCPGTARLSGNLNDEGTEITGRLDANDCTGDISGTFVFRREG